MDLEIVEFREGRPREYGYTAGGWYYVNRRASDSPSGHSIVYVGIEGESFWENFADRTSRPHTAWRPYVIQALKNAGVEFKNIRWSQKAGCSCPCSPGFIVQGGTYPAKDYWVTLRVQERQTTNPDESEFRLNQLLSDPTIAGALQ